MRCGIRQSSVVRDEVWHGEGRGVAPYQEVWHQTQISGYE